MSLQNQLLRQIEAFHAAILDSCDRASRPAQGDAMALRLRVNALALAKAQLAMVALLRTEPSEPIADSHLEEPPAADPDRATLPPPDAIWPVRAPEDAPPPDQPPAAPAEPPLARPYPWPDDQEDRVTSGDVLSRFVSRRLMPDESPHEVWRGLQESDAARQPRDPALPRAGFRSSSR
jgi:hypothetical protein